MKREIKFRAWDLDAKDKMYHWEEISRTFIEHLNHPRVAVMQFTGLTDKNGKEIYEGDLISESNSSPYEVKWQYHSVKWIMQSFEEGRYYREMHSDYAKNNYEIIGNIYENKELL
jgi:uncharacterized phage protein (TIGR01671 family)